MCVSARASELRGCAVFNFQIQGSKAMELIAVTGLGVYVQVSVTG